MKVRKLIVFNSKMGIRKFWSVALPFGKVACVVESFSYILLYRYLYYIYQSEITKAPRL